MIAQWTAGCDEARVSCEAVGIRPPVNSTPTWWTNPHDFDPVDGGHAAAPEPAAEEPDDDADNDDEDSPAGDDKVSSDSDGDSDGAGSWTSPKDNASAGVREAVEALEAVEQLEVRETFPMSLPVPDCGDVHKARIAKCLAGEVK